MLAKAAEKRTARRGGGQEERAAFPRLRGAAFFMPIFCRMEVVNVAVELNDRQERFCQAYVFECRGNGTEAAIRAGYSENRKSAGEHASRLSRNVKIRARIAELKKERLAASGWDRDMLKDVCIEELVGMATARLTDFVNISPDKDDPNREAVLKELAACHGGQTLLDFGDMLITPTHALTDDEAGALKSVKQGKFGMEIEMYDRIAAIKLLAEIAGFKEADTSVSVNVSPSVILQQAEARRRSAEDGRE